MQELKRKTTDFMAFEVEHMHCLQWFWCVVAGHHNEPQKPSKRGRKRRTHVGAAHGDLQAGNEQLTANT